jgi:outer membrane biosynthesis protein TonB
MAIGPVGNTIYVNQQMASVASDKNVQLNRFELQALAAQMVTQEQEKEIQDVRPTEENQKADPDREHAKEQAEQEERRSKHEEHETPKEEASKSIHILDIKV